MKIFIEQKTGEGENETWTKKKESNSKLEAKAEKLPGERIHICYHDEVPPKPCRVE